ncbi:peptidyl-prolyl cis-trans isomerase D-like isoform X2 [Chrysoperla carnea]|nr:peptidyl-prolyl cis-trans isomerase D-like isoform X2 [Chrysoperla carnea]
MVQGGDIINFDGTGGESIYGEKFEDENFNLTHEQEGVLSMANAGPNTNSSQFFITTVPCTHLDGINVAFGKVRKGFGVVKEISEVKADNGRPIPECKILNCGQLRRNENWGIEDADCTDDVYPPWPEDWQRTGKEEIHDYMDVVNKIKNSGNYHFSNKNYVESDRKYRKALRYINFSTKVQMDSDGPDYDRSTLNNIKVISLLNLAAVKLKRNDFKEARDCCIEVLTIDPNSSKALYRRGQAYVGLKEYQLALKDFKMALRLCPHDKRIVGEMKKLQNTINLYLVEEKKVFSKMFEC